MLTSMSKTDYGEWDLREMGKSQHEFQCKACIMESKTVTCITEYSVHYHHTDLGGLEIVSSIGVGGCFLLSMTSSHTKSPLPSSRQRQMPR
jgi:hypothetical protein